MGNEIKSDVMCDERFDVMCDMCLTMSRYNYPTLGTMKRRIDRWLYNELPWLPKALYSKHLLSAHRQLDKIWGSGCPSVIEIRLDIEGSGDLIMFEGMGLNESFRHVPFTTYVDLS